MDGTGLLFKPLVDILGIKADVRVISYPTHEKLSYVELTELVTKQLPDEDYFLVAESFSGPIAYQIAKKYPKNLKVVVFIATFLTSPNRLLTLLTKLPMGLLFKIPIPAFLIKRYFLGRGVDSDTIELFRKSIKSVSSRVLSFRLNEMKKLKTESATLLIPCVYIQAKNDKLVSENHVNEFKKISPQVKVVVIESPHFVAQVSPKRCSEVILEFAQKS